MPMKNREIANHLKLISQLMSADGAGSFKVRAFEDAADTISKYSIPLETINPTTIPGIGKSIAACIKQFIETGTSDKLDKLAEHWPPSIMEMTRINGIGPKTATKFYQEHGIKNFDELCEFAKKGTLKPEMIQAIEFAKQYTGRFPFEQAKELADYVKGLLLPVVDKIEVCGSLRRKAPTIKDIDIVACANDRQAAFNTFVKLGSIINVGEKKSSIRVNYSSITMQVDLWVVDSWHWGAALNYATGSKDHNISIRNLAKSRGLLVNEYGIFPAEVADYNKQTQLGGREETDIYRVLGLDYVEPENRNDSI